MAVDIAGLFNGSDYGHVDSKSGATGKYYFKWNDHGYNIKRITGVKNQQEFLNSPEAQEKYFTWYSENKLKPSVDKLNSLNKAGYTPDELAKLIHFKGETGAKRWLQQNVTPIVRNTPESAVTPNTITPADRDAWEKMQGAAYQRGIYPNDFGTPKGGALMSEFGIDPKRLPDFQADLLKRQADQQQPGALPLVAHGFSTGKAVDDPSQPQRYDHYQSQVGTTPVQDFGTNTEAFIAEQNKIKQAQDARWEGFGDPTKDINYKPPGTVSGFTSSPGMDQSSRPTMPDPRFPTRNDITGVVTPAAMPVATDNQKSPRKRYTEYLFNLDKSSQPALASQDEE